MKMETTSTRSRQGVTGCIRRHVKGYFCAGNGSRSPQKRVVAVADKEHETSSLSWERKGGMSKGPRNLQLKVRWNDHYGKKLVHEHESKTSDKNEDLCPCGCHIM